MNTCKNCKHWSKYPAPDAKWGVCMSILMHPINDKSIYQASKPLKEVTAKDQIFNTGENFGCNQFQNFQITKN